MSLGLNTIDPLLDGLHELPGPGELEPFRCTIARCFSASSVEEIIDALKSEPSEARSWAQTVASELDRRSPTSLKITHRHIRDAKLLDLRLALRVDYRLACRCLEAHDLYDGVRAALIDKDRSPRWSPARLADVTANVLADYFAPRPGDELDLPTRQEMQALRV